MAVTETKRTFCRICIAQCGMQVTVDDDRVVAIRGDSDHPFSRGYLCAKGRALGEAHHAPNRLSGASIGRVTSRRAVSIDEGHADLAAALQGIVDQHGLGAIGVFHGTGAFTDALGTWTARKFKRALGTDQLYSTATVDAIAKTLVASEMGGTPLLIPNIDEEAGRLLVFVGINPVVSHGHATMFSNPVDRIRQARRRGPVVTIDPRTTETARLSDHHMAVRPATDYAVFAHVIRELFASGAVDETALAERATGIDGLRRAVEIFDADATAALAGVTTEQLGVLVDAVRAAGRLAILSGTGSTMNPTANLGEWMAWALMVVTDSFDQPGGMWFNPGVFARLDRFETLPSAAPIAPASPARPDVARCGGEWPAALIVDEIESGRLRALVVLGANLLTALPEPERLAEALARIDALVVLDVVSNATTELATHVFACAGQLERPDVISLETNASARYQQYTDAVVAPRPERPPMWETLVRIGAGIGLDVLAGRQTVVESTSVTPDQMFERLARGAGVAELRAAGGIHVEGGPLYDWVRPRLPHGRWDLAPVRLADQLSALRAAGAAPRGLMLTPRRLMKRMNCQLFRVGEVNEALVNPTDASRLGLADGDLIDVGTETGSIRLPARVTDSIVAGAVSIVHGFDDANVNALVDRNDLDRLSGMVRLSAVPVTVTAV
jgi:anaerobic selenocysteine-containing dehydrogenase